MEGLRAVAKAILEANDGSVSRAETEALSGHGRDRVPSLHESAEKGNTSRLYMYVLSRFSASESVRTPSWFPTLTTK